VHFRSLVSWRGVKQELSSFLSTESEFVTASVALTEGAWLSQLVKKLGFADRLAKMF
jgi:hypothetical protein